MELRHLRYFVAIAEDLHFGRAAERLHITQPVLSQQIASLEAKLGFPLFKRNKRRVELTQAGAFFLEEARQILQKAERAVQLAERTARGELGQLTIGYTPSALHRVLVRVIPLFRSHYPDVLLNLIKLCTEDQVLALRTGQIDIGFLHPPLRDRQLILLEILKEPFVVVLPKGHRLLIQSCVSLADLSEEYFVIPPRREWPYFYDLFLKNCQHIGFEPKIIETNNGIDLVVAGLGITITSESFQFNTIAGVDWRPLIPIVHELALAAAWKEDNISSVLQVFNELLHPIKDEVSNFTRDSI
jgi:DNA-binding transcriptional LysR family regulator